MFELINFMTAGKFFIIIAGELILIFIAVSFIIGVIRSGSSYLKRLNGLATFSVQVSEH